MDMGSSRLTVFFEDPFWVGVFEREEGGGTAAVRVVFGAEPKDCQVYAFVLEHYHRLKFGAPLPGADRPPRPKPRREQKSRGVGTKAQQALQLQREMSKTAQRQRRREDRQAVAERKFELKQRKKREKRRGR